MGDSEIKIEKIEYTAEEQEEISRIVGVITSSDVTEPPVSDTFEPSEVSDEILMDSHLGEPDDLDLPAVGLDEISNEEEIQFDETATFEDSIEQGEEEISFDTVEEDFGADIQLEEPGLDEGIPEEAFEIEGMEDIPLDEGISEIAGEDLGEVAEDEIEDISDLITEVEEPEVPLDEGISDFDQDDLSSIDQLDALTEEEPESIDIQDMADQEFVDSGEPFEDISAEEIEEPPSTGVELSDELDESIPDLSDLSLEESGDLPELDESEIPDMDLDDIGGVEEPDLGADLGDGIPEIEGLDDEGEISDEGLPDIESIGEEVDISGEELPEIEGLGEEGDLSSDEIPEIDEVEDGGFGGEDFPEIEGIEAGEEATAAPDEGIDFSEESLMIEPLEEEAGQEGSGAVEYTEGDEGEEIELSDSELKRLKKAILLFNSGLRQAIKDVVINDLLSTGDTRKLVNMILEGRSEDNIRRFIEDKLQRKIETVEEKGPGRRVITSRPEYTREGIERQKRLLKITKIFSLAVIAAFIITILSYNYIYKPIMAKKMINQGVALILKPGDYSEKPKDYKNAEGLAKTVNEDYVENYLYGYNEYAKAYFAKKEYGKSLDKLNKGYIIDNQNFSVNNTDIDTLNSLGDYYSKVPSKFYSRIRSDVEKTYYPQRKPQREERSQLDVAIEFYKRVLVLDNTNGKALLGIGNAYFHQGQYMKSKKYYEDILKADPGSVIGFSGLLNLYIERDSFALVASTHAELKDRGLEAKMPSALLGKLVDFYLSKRRTADHNMRVDHAVQSPRIIDDDDNTYPAVRSVLSALSERDPDYPPLQLHTARFNKLKNNQKVMKRYLDRALELSPNYFGALNMMGKYYYDIKEPVTAFKYMSRAIKVYGNQPDFTREEFYKETENIGESYAVRGNVFYYFFDKVRYRYENLEEEVESENIERMANYNYSKDQYEKALQGGFESSELHYNLGRIYYMNKRYAKALDQWLNLYEDFVKSPELMFALGNAFFHLGKYEASKGEYLKLISVSEDDADSISLVELGKSDHVKLFQGLASTYNNLGAVYQIQGNESKSTISYWKGIDYAKRLGVENEFARVNMARSFNRARKVEPILDENIPYSIDIYREDMR